MPVIPSRAGTLELFVGTCGNGRSTAGSTTIDQLQFSALPGQLTAVTITSADIGMPISIAGAGPVDPLTPAFVSLQGSTLVSTIVAILSPTSIQIADAATTTYAGIGTVAVYRPCDWVIDTLTYQSNIAPSTRDTLDFTTLQRYGYFARNVIVCAGQPVYLRSTDGAVGDIFGGEIDTVTISNQLVPTAGSTGAGLTAATNASDTQPFSYAVTCVSWDSIAARRIVQPEMPQTFTGVNADVVFKTCALTYLSNEGIGLSVVAGPAISLNCPAGSYASDILNQVCSLANGADPLHTYFWFTDEWKTVHFQTEATTNAPWSVDDTAGSAGNVLLAVNVQTTHAQYSNACYVVANLILQQAYNTTFVGTGTSSPLTAGVQIFSVPQPIYAPPSITLNGSPQTVGVLNVDTGMEWYWSQGSAAITQNPADAAISPSDVLIVTSQTATPGIALAYNDNGLAARIAVEGVAALYESSQTISVPITPQDLVALTQGNAATQGQIPATLTATTLRGGLHAGQLQPIRLATIGIDGDFLISQITMTTSDNIIYWDYAAIAGSSVGNWATAWVQFINRGQSQLSLLSPTAPISAAAVNTPTNHASGILPWLAFPSAVTAGNLLVVVAARNAVLGNPPGIVDTLGNTWTQAAFAQGHNNAFPSFPNQLSILWAIANSNGLCTVTVSSANELIVAEFPGIKTPPVDVVGISPATDPTAPVTITTTQADLIITASMAYTGVPTVSAPEVILEGPGGDNLTMCWVQTTAAGPFTSSLDAHSSGQYDVAYATVAFRTAGGIPPAQPPVDVVGNPAGTVTHTTGPLTANLPVFGNGGSDIKVGMKQGTGITMQCAAGSYVIGAPLIYDAGGNAISGVFPVGGLSVNTKGDLQGYDTAPDRVPVGANGYVLTADSTQALGLKWAAGGGGGGLVLLEQHTASNSAELDFTASITSTYDDYEIRLANMIPASNNDRSVLQFSTDGGSTYDSSAIYSYGYIGGGGSSVGFSTVNNDTSFELTYQQDNGGNYGANGEFRLISPGSSIYKPYNGHGGNITSGFIEMRLYHGYYANTTPVNAFRVKFASSNITSGIVRCYGVAK